MANHASTFGKVGGWIISAVLALTLVSAFSAAAHAEDAIEIQAGGWITHYNGVLISRTEEGDIGEIQFGARSFTTRLVVPRPTPGPTPVGHYGITVIPHDGSVQGYIGEPCRRVEAIFQHVSGATFMRFVCP